MVDEDVDEVVLDVDVYDTEYWLISVAGLVYPMFYWPAVWLTHCGCTWKHRSQLSQRCITNVGQVNMTITHWSSAPLLVTELSWCAPVLGHQCRSSDQGTCSGGHTGAGPGSVRGGSSVVTVQHGTPAVLNTTDLNIVITTHYITIHCPLLSITPLHHQHHCKMVICTQAD